MTKTYELGKRRKRRCKQERHGKSNQQMNALECFKHQLKNPEKNIEL